MGAQTLHSPGVSDVCRRVDEWLSCTASSYMDYNRYLVGQAPDITGSMRVVALRDILCERGCGLCPDEIDKLVGQLNRMLS